MYEAVYEKIVEAFQGVEGIIGIVLGGSRATNTYTADSDIDIGLYYDNKLFSAAHLQQAATTLDDDHREQLMTAIGEWGQGVNGGGWLQVDGMKVDILYRDLDKVKTAIAEAERGEIKFLYQTGHPHAFLNLMYVGEMHCCKVLWQKEDTIQQVKNSIQHYPKKLQQAALDYFGFEMDFSAMFIEGQLGKQDLHYMMGHAFRSISCLIQYLYALNEMYCLNEKKAVKNVSRLSSVPKHFTERVNGVYRQLGCEDGQVQAVADLQDLIVEAKALRGMD